MTSAREKQIESFVKQNWGFAQEVSKQFAINPLIVLSQSALETAWGTSNLAKNHKNYFGLTTGGKNAKTPFWAGQTYISQNQYKIPFRSYDSARNGFLDFGYFIKNFKSYTSVRPFIGNIYQYADAIAASKYISESNGDNRDLYKRTLIRNYEDIVSWAKKKSQDPVAVEVVLFGAG